MGAADPTYPLYPIASILAATLLLLVLLTSFIRQNWNLGVTFLCFWIFLENLTGAANTIIWSDNADIKHYVYCDIGVYFTPLLSGCSNTLPVSHLDMITCVVKPMATLIITRRLYLIASLQSVELPSKSAVQYIVHASKINWHVLTLHSGEETWSSNGCWVCSSHSLLRARSVSVPPLECRVVCIDCGTRLRESGGPIRGRTSHGVHR